MPGQLLMVSNLSQYFSLGKPIFSPIKKGPLDGVRMNSTCPPLALILSTAVLMGENMGYPKEKYWDRILAITNCPGIHFADYPAIAHFICPEFSHLSQPDAILFTKDFIRILQEEKGWKFSKMTGL